MTQKTKPTFTYKHCFHRKDWAYNRRRSGLSTCKKDMDRLLCDLCKHRQMCLEPNVKFAHELYQV
jgi:hypothetical protein